MKKTKMTWKQKLESYQKQTYSICPSCSKDGYTKYCLLCGYNTPKTYTASIKTFNNSHELHGIKIQETKDILAELDLLEKSLNKL